MTLYRSCFILFIITCTNLPIAFTVNNENSSNIERFKGPDYCVTCHRDETLAWMDSLHAQSYSDQEFQEKMKELGEPVSCLKCHTTGYNKETGKYAFKGVTCEACHGPGDAMNRDVSPELCGECHTGPYPTYKEWKKSDPGHGNATCILCHDEHNAELITPSSTGTCSLCHESHVEDLSDTKHGDANVECAECHMYRKPANFEEGIPAITGHTFSMTGDQLDCSTCHERTLFKHDILGKKAYACLSCHGAIHSLELELVNGSTFPLEEPVSLCGQCHNERFTAWEGGTHGEPNEPYSPCTDCHDPHNPLIYQFSTLSSLPERRPPRSPQFFLPLSVVGILAVFAFAIVVLRRR